MARPPQSIHPRLGLYLSILLVLFCSASLANDVRDGLSGTRKDCAIFSITRPLCIQ